MRLFVALDLPQALRDELMAVQDGLGLGREVPEHDLHLTLAFLGDQPDASAETLHALLEAVRAVPTRLTIRGVDLFGGRSASAAVALVQRVPELIALQEKVAWAVRRAGMDLPRRRFKPHITLARFPRRVPEAARGRMGAWLARNGDRVIRGPEATQFSLYRSQLYPDGPLYQPLASYPLSGGCLVSGGGAA